MIQTALLGESKCLDSITQDKFLGRLLFIVVVLLKSVLI